jgi:pSer/pThr/pTyr-binding forkhead associated (FHA) protein
MTATNRLQALLIAGLLACDGVLGQPEPTAPAALARDIVLVLDNSGSMRQNDPAALARQAVATFVGQMDPDTHIGMVFFDSDAREVLPLTCLGDTTPEALNQKLDGLDYRGLRTNLAAALERAIYSLKQHGRSEASRSVVFLTDGVTDMGDRAKDRDSARWLRDELAADATDQGIAIFSIALGNQADVLLLHAMAQKTEGDYFRAERAEDLAAVMDEMQSALLSRATPPPIAPKVAEEPAPAPSTPEPVPGAEPGPAEPPTAPAEPPTAPAEPPTAPEIVASVAPEAVPPAAPVPSFPPSVPPGPDTGPAPGGLPDRLAPWLIGFSALLALFLAFVAARILTWVKKAAQAPKGAALASATHEALPKAFLHDLSGTTNWKHHRFEKPLTWLGRIVMEPKAEDADHLVVDKGTVGRRHAFIEYQQHDFWITDHDSINGTFVNGRPIHTKARLKHGDHIRLGDCEFTFEMPAMALVEETSVAPAYVRNTIVGRPEREPAAAPTPFEPAADPASLEPVAPFVAVEIGAVGEDHRPEVATREEDVTDPEAEAPAPQRKGMATNPHGLKEDLADATLPSRKALKEDLKSYFEDS